MKLFRHRLIQVFASFFILIGFPAMAQIAPTANEIAVLRASAERGDAEAQFTLGYRYAAGLGVMKSEVESFKWFRKSAEQGNKGAQYNLAYYYAHGVGVERNEVETVKWYRKAAEQGVAKAQFNLFLHYTYGPVVVKTEATKWLHKAAEQGHGNAQSNVAFRYFTGDGVVKNDLLAYQWFLLAVANGYDENRDSLALLEKRLSVEQRAEGRRFATQWQAAFEKRRKEE